MAAVDSEPVSLTGSSRGDGELDCSCVCVAGDGGTSSGGTSDVGVLSDIELASDRSLDVLRGVSFGTGGLVGTLSCSRPFLVSGDGDVLGTSGNVLLVTGGSCDGST